MLHTAGGPRDCEHSRVSPTNTCGVTNCFYHTGSQMDSINCKQSQKILHVFGIHSVICSIMIYSPMPALLYKPGGNPQWHGGGGDNFTQKGAALVHHTHSSSFPLSPLFSTDRKCEDLCCCSSSLHYKSDLHFTLYMLALNTDGPTSTSKT